MLHRAGTITIPTYRDTTTSGSTAAPVADPLRALLAAGPAASPHDTATVQVLIRPSHTTTARTAPASGATARVASLVLDFLTPGPRSRPARPTHALQAAQAPQLGFCVQLRYHVSTTRTGAAARKQLRHRASTLAAAVAGVFTTPGARHQRIHRPDAVIRARAMRGGTTLTAHDVALLAHIPSDEIVPALPRARARHIAPATAIPSGGRGTKPLGTASVGGRKIALSRMDARYHVHAIGPTGVGKSTFLLNMALSDIRAHRGCVVIDPKGDLVTDILDRLDPEAVAGRLRIIDPAQPAPHWGIDPLAGTDHDLVVDNLVSICRRIFERHWGPRADDILRNALLTLLRIPGSSLQHLPSLLSKTEFRAPYIAHLDEPWGLGGFWHWYDGLSPAVQSQAAGPVLSRIRALLSREFMRTTIGAPAYTFDMHHALNHGGIVLARLPKGVLGDDSARLLGSILVAKVWQATTARADTPPDKRRDASIYIDEAHNFLNLPQSVDDILAEARGYGLSMTLAHQYIAQLSRELQFALSANARTKIYFATSPEDARILSRHTLPNLTEHDLAHLDAYHAACRSVVDGAEQPSFSLKTLPPPTAIGDADAVRRAARPTPHQKPHPNRSTSDVHQASHPSPRRGKNKPRNR